MSNIGLFVNVNDLYHLVNRKFPRRKLDYAKYLEKLGSIKYKIAYGVQEDDQATNFIVKLKYLGFDVKYIQSSYKINTRVDLVLDILRLSERLDSVVLGTNNLEYNPLIEHLKEKGIDVTIYCTKIPKILLRTCKFIPIEEDLLHEESI